MAATEYLRKLLTQKHIEECELNRVPRVLRILSRRKYQNKELQIMLANNEINHAIEEDTYYMLKNGPFMYLKNARELEEARKKGLEQLDYNMRLIFVKSLCDAIRYDYDIDLYPYVKYPNLTEGSDYYEMSISGSVITDNQAIGFNGGSYVVTGDDIRQYGAEFNEEKLSKFNPDLNELPDYFHFTNYSDNPFTRNHI